MEIRTLVTTFDGFNQDLEQAIAPEKVRPQANSALPELPPVDGLPLSLTLPLSGEAQTRSLLRPIDTAQWIALLPADQGYYIVALSGQAMPERVNVDVVSSYRVPVAPLPAIAPAMAWVAA